MAKKIKRSSEPTLHVHRWIVAIIRQCANGKTHTGFAYCANLGEVQQRVKDAPKGAVVEVYSAVHNFREAWQK